MPRARNTETRRSEITRALRSVMARKGYPGASVADVARTARLTPGLVHYHFASKLEILLALLDDLAAQHQARMRQALAAAGPPPAQVDAFVDLHLSRRAADPEALACWVALSGEALREPRVRRRYRQVVQRWVEVLAAVIESGRGRAFAAADATAAACAIVSAIQGYFVLAAVDRTLIPRGSAAESVKKMAAGLLGRAERTGPGKR